MGSDIGETTQVGRLPVAHPTEAAAAKSSICDKQIVQEGGMNIMLTVMCPFVKRAIVPSNGPIVPCCPTLMQENVQRGSRVSPHSTAPSLSACHRDLGEVWEFGCARRGLITRWRIRAREFFHRGATLAMSPGADHEREVDEVFRAVHVPAFEAACHRCRDVLARLLRKHHDGTIGPTVDRTPLCARALSPQP